MKPKTKRETTPEERARFNRVRLAQYFSRSLDRMAAITSQAGHLRAGNVAAPDGWKFDYDELAALTRPCWQYLYDALASATDGKLKRRNGKA